MSTMHQMTFTESEFAILKDLLRQNLQCINEIRQDLKVYERKAYSKCDIEDESLASRINFKYLNSIRTSDRKLLKKQRKLEILQNRFKNSFSQYSV